MVADKTEFRSVIYPRLSAVYFDSIKFLESDGNSAA